MIFERLPLLDTGRGRAFSVHRTSLAVRCLRRSDRTPTRATIQRLQKKCSSCDAMESHIDAYLLPSDRTLSRLIVTAAWRLLVSGCIWRKTETRVSRRPQYSCSALLATPKMRGYILRCTREVTIVEMTSADRQVSLFSNRRPRDLLPPRQPRRAQPRSTMRSRTSACRCQRRHNGRHW